ncbi:DUF58 domain-containing protein [Tuberibacillus calidus]|uniref:DUF58 domain-containing protein n=1 Tax=Tuberibacillus calidus TaxID=340097 RepID=UPI0004035551|nr:DUF58 domain-containing protein [Tuberibacillus calidus]
MIRRLRRYRPTLGLFWVVVLFLIAFCYAMFQGGFVSWFVFYSFLPVFLYTILLMFYPLHDVHIERLVDQEELYAEEPLQVTIKLTRNRPFPLFYLIIEDHAPENMLKKHAQLTKETTKALVSLGFRKQVVFDYRIDGMPRGDYRFREVTIKTGDLFGFVQKQKTFRVEQRVLVYPKVITPKKWLPLDLSQGGRLRSRRNFEVDLTSISSIRDYIPGDRLSWLDWKATARTNKLVTKQFEFPLNKDIVVVLDRTGQSSSDDFERAVSLAASLSDRALRTGSAVGFGSFGKETTWVTRHDQTYQKWVILHHLASAEQDGAMDITYLFNKYVRHLSPQTTLVYITPHLSERLIWLFNDLLSRSLALELFFCAEKPLPVDYHLLEKLKALGVYAHIVSDDRFDEIPKAGDTVATI